MKPIQTPTIFDRIILSMHQNCQSSECSKLQQEEAMYLAECVRRHAAGRIPLQMTEAEENALLEEYRRKRKELAVSPDWSAIFTDKK